MAQSRQLPASSCRLGRRPRRSSAFALCIATRYVAQTYCRPMSMRVLAAKPGRPSPARDGSGRGDPGCVLAVFPGGGAIGAREGAPERVDRGERLWQKPRLDRHPLEAREGEIGGFPVLRIPLGRCAVANLHSVRVTRPPSVRRGGSPFPHQATLSGDYSWHLFWSDDATGCLNRIGC